MSYVGDTTKSLLGKIIVLCTYAIEGKFPLDYMPRDEAWENLDLTIANLSSKLGEDRGQQLLQMASQAKTHFDSGEIKLGAWLMQDMERVVKGQSQFAYPAERYRWPIGNTNSQMNTQR